MDYSKTTSISLLDNNDKKKISSTTDKKSSNNNSTSAASLLFPVQNFFAVGSPLGVILLLRGYKIAARKSIEADQINSSTTHFGDMSHTPTTISFCYPAVDNLYNIFHKVTIYSFFIIIIHCCIFLTYIKLDSVFKLLIAIYINPEHSPIQ